MAKEPTTRAELIAKQAELMAKIKKYQANIDLNNRNAGTDLQILESGQVRGRPIDAGYREELKRKLQPRLDQIAKDQAVIDEARTELDVVDAQLEAMG